MTDEQWLAVIDRLTMLLLAAGESAQADHRRVVTLLLKTRLLDELGDTMSPELLRRIADTRHTLGYSAARDLGDFAIARGFLEKLMADEGFGSRQYFDYASWLFDLLLRAGDGLGAVRMLSDMIARASEAGIDARLWSDVLMLLPRLKSSEANERLEIASVLDSIANRLSRDDKPTLSEQVLATANRLRS